MTEPRCSGTKTCTKCGEEKSVLAFAANRTTSDGLHYWCRGCVSLSARDAPSARARRERAAERSTQEAIDNNLARKLIHDESRR